VSLIRRNISLKPYNTFGLDYKADCLITIYTEEEAESLFRNEKHHNPFFIIGEGSNLLFTEDFNGTIFLTDIGEIKVEEADSENVIISAGAGINWDRFVEWTVEKGYGGLENLSLIPGRVGAAPVQNIGAYGVEIRDTLIKVKTVSCIDGSVREFSNQECDFSYRNSIFKNSEKGKCLVTRIYLKLNLNPLLNLNYGSLKTEVEKLGKTDLRNVRQAVINIRRSKLPDPEQIGNAGSFFRNPVVDVSFAEAVKNEYPQIPYFMDPAGGIKLAAGWLIEQCGWKGKRLGDAGVHDRQALVLVNHGTATGKEIYGLSEMIRESVAKRFGVLLEREVEIVGTI